jgi:hypothetical protein
MNIAYPNENPNPKMVLLNLNHLQLKFAVNIKYSSFINGRLNIATKCSIVKFYDNYASLQVQQ